MADTVQRIEYCGFSTCTSLVSIRLSSNLEYIGRCAFHRCWSLPSIFIPPSCRVIDDQAFQICSKLIILSIPRNTQLGHSVIAKTELFEASPFTANRYGLYHGDNESVNDWIKIHHDENEFSLHRACSDSNPRDDVIFEIIKRKGLKAFEQPDRVGVTPSQYLFANPYAEIDENKIVNRYILFMMGEIV